MTPADPRKLTVAITLLAMAAFASAAAARLCDPLLPAFEESFAVSKGIAAYTVSSFALAFGLLQAVYGPLGDRYGKYRVIAGATLACVVGNLGAALAPDIGTLVACRTLSGATSAAIIPLSLAWVGDQVAYEHRQGVLARFLTGQILGLIGGQFLGGVFVDTVGWRWGFVFMATVYGLVGIALWRQAGRQAGWQAGQQGPEAAAAAPRSSIVTQFRSVFAIPWARFVMLSVALEGFGLYGALAFVPSYLHDRFGVSLTVAGGMFAAFGLGGLGYTFIARRLVAAIGEAGLALTGGLLMLAGLVLLVMAPAPAWAVPAALLAGHGFYMFHNTLQINGTQMAPHARGTAMAAFASAFFVGQFAGVAMAGWWVDRVGIPPILWAAALAMILIGAGFARALHRHRPKS